MCVVSEILLFNSNPLRAHDSFVYYKHFKGSISCANHIFISIAFPIRLDIFCRLNFKAVAHFEILPTVPWYLLDLKYILHVYHFAYVHIVCESYMAKSVSYLLLCSFQIFFAHLILIIAFIFQNEVNLFNWLVSDYVESLPIVHDASQE